MKDDSYARYIRFHTPDPLIAPREQAPMSAEEQARALERGAVHRFSWITVLLPPLCFGPALPAIAFIGGLAACQALVAPELDIDRAIGDSAAGLVLATLAFTLAWAVRNYWREKHDRTKRYWQALPNQGVVELERHVLVQGISVWSNSYDPDCNTLSLWQNGKLVHVQDSGVTQWLLCKTSAGYWLVLKKNYPGRFTYERVGRRPSVEEHLQPQQQIAIALAPGTNLMLGQRFGGAPLPVLESGYWLNSEETNRLTEAAHHWMFFHPQRYGVVSEDDVQWLERLIDKAKAQTATPA